MNVLQENYKLENGVEIPKLALGTWMISNDEVEDAVREALKIGYRHIDTAQAYKNEQGVGEALRDCEIPREDVFITSKLAAEIKSYDKAVEAIDESLRVMGVDYIDLMIIHSPKPWDKFKGDDHFFEGNLEAWKALEEAYKDGKLKAIGVSNFEVVDLKNILDNCEIKPMVNQVLAHISNTPSEVIKFCEKEGILVEAYSPIGHGELLNNSKLKEMADRYGVSVPQLSIRYDLQLGLLPLPKSTKPDHMKSNAEVDFEISEEDMETLQNMPRMKDYGKASDMPIFN